MKLILGSKSPRRKELLNLLDLTFSIETFEVEENYPKSIQIKEVSKFLSELKSNGFRKLNDDELLITSDTIVIQNETVLGKPINESEAKSMLSSLSNSMNEVITGVTLRTNKKTITFSTSTQVYFDALTEGEIQYYIQKYKPFDKAGSYGIQEWIGAVGIKKINGCFYNVMGLPLHDLMKVLKDEFNHSVTNDLS